MQAAGHGEVELYAVAAREEDRARDFARQYGMPCAFGSYEAMLQDPAVDFVYIATPHSHHYRHIRLCVDHGKPVLCEKAFTVNARQADDVLRRARAPGCAGDRGHLDPVPAHAPDAGRGCCKAASSAGRSCLTANLGYAMTQNGGLWTRPWPGVPCWTWASTP